MTTQNEKLRMRRQRNIDRRDYVNPNHTLGRRLFDVQRLMNFLCRNYPQRYKINYIARSLQYPATTLIEALNDLKSKNVVDHTEDGWLLTSHPYHYP